MNLTILFKWHTGNILSISQKHFGDHISYRFWNFQFFHKIQFSFLGGVRPMTGRRQLNRPAVGRPPLKKCFFWKNLKISKTVSDMITKILLGYFQYTTWKYGNIYWFGYYTALQTFSIRYLQNGCKEVCTYCLVPDVGGWGWSWVIVLDSMWKFPNYIVPII